MATIFIKNGILVNEGMLAEGSILVCDGLIKKIYVGDSPKNIEADELIDAEGNYVIPGVIDDQVHFREPGLTQKADIRSESKAAAAGGVTSYMEMPNTNPQTTTQEELAKKFAIAKDSSFVNYSFYIGATNDNIDELLKTDAKNVCGVKVFMGSSTGNMLVDKPESLDAIFSSVTLPIAVHCEDEQTIRANSALYKQKYGEDVPIRCHPEIRSDEACYKSSSLAVSLAKKHGARLHVLHVSTAKELELFDNTKPIGEKKITAEVCVHHLWFSDADYADKGVWIKWNPAVKNATDRDALFQAMLDDKLDVIATDHAPHLRSEKDGTYFNAASGGPLVQHSLVAMFEFFHQKKMSVETIVDKMCHKPAQLFNVSKRGFLREDYFADIAIVNPNKKWTVSPDNLLYKCQWSPFDGYTFSSQVTHTIVNGQVVFSDGKFVAPAGMALQFDR